MKKYDNRSEVPEEYKWNLTSFFKDEKEFDEVYENAKKNVLSLTDYIGCTKCPSRTYEYLIKYYEALALKQRIYAYSRLINDQKLGINENIVRKNKARHLNSLLLANSNFFEAELLKLNNDEYEKLFIDEPKLEDFRKYLNKIYRFKAHILSEDEEKFIMELVNAMNNYEDMYSNLLNSEHDYGKVKLDDGTKVDITPNNYRSLMKNKNINIRKKVYKLFNSKLDQYSSTNASLLNSYISMNNSIAKIYHYKDSWHQKLFDLNLSDKVFKVLVNTTEKNLATLHKYYKLKSKVLGLDNLHMYDMPLAMVKLDKEYTIDEAQKLIRDVIKPLGEEYQRKYDKIIKNRYIDYCQYKGKYSGGYSFATITHDSRILMNFNYNLESISTLAHEIGHNVHHQIVNENNPLQYRYIPNLVAEVVSLTNECLLSNYLVNNAKTKDEKLAGLNNFLGVISFNLFGAVREGKMEEEMYKEVYNGGTITKDFMDSLAKKSMKKYYGSAVKMDKYSKKSWVTRDHYFSHFYLYSYAICISVALYVASKIIDGDKEMLNRYYEFMKCGSNMWPYEIFKVLGVDLEDKTVYENAIKYFDSLIDKYYEIYNLTL